VDVWHLWKIPGPVNNIRVMRAKDRQWPCDGITYAERCLSRFKIKIYLRAWNLGAGMRHFVWSSPKVWCSVPGRGERLYLYPQRSDRLWGSPSLQSLVHQAWHCPTTKLTTHVLVVPRLQMRRCTDRTDSKEKRKNQTRTHENGN
jgi:hypothetical protein